MKQRTFTLLAFLLISGALAAQKIDVPEQQRSLVMKHTATWCPPCGATAWDIFEGLVANYAGEAVFLQVHISESSLFFSENAEDLLDNCDNSFFQPEFFHNTNRIGSGSGSTQTDIETLIEESALTAPLAQTGIRFTYEPVSRQLDIQTNTRFFGPADGDYFLSVLLAYREVEGYQESRGQGQRHKHVLRQALTPGTFGELIISGDIETGAAQSLDLTASLPEDMDIARSEIVAVLWRQNEEGRYDFVNANLQQTATEVTTARVYPAKLPARLTVAPNIVQQNFQLSIDLSRFHRRVDITLFNLLGQPVQQLYQGALAGGGHRLSFQRPVRVSSGIYLLRMRAGKEVITRRVIFR